MTDKYTELAREEAKKLSEWILAVHTISIDPTTLEEPIASLLRRVAREAVEELDLEAHVPRMTKGSYKATVIIEGFADAQPIDEATNALRSRAKELEAE